MENEAYESSPLALLGYIATQVVQLYTSLHEPCSHRIPFALLLICPYFVVPIGVLVPVSFSAPLCNGHNPFYCLLVCHTLPYSRLLLRGPTFATLLKWPPGSFHTKLTKKILTPQISLKIGTHVGSIGKPHQTKI